MPWDVFLLEEVDRFVFDPQRQAILLLGGDKAGDWKDLYARNIPIAGQRYEDWLRGLS